MSNRDDIIQKIRALRAKAADSASTEAEAMEAAMMATKLLIKHDVQEDEMQEMVDTGATEGAFGPTKKANAKQKLHPVLFHCWYGLQTLTETKTYVKGGVSLAFIGVPSDVEMGIYLCEMLVGAAKRMWVDYGNTLYGLSYDALMSHREGFMQGFGTRVNERLLELAEERKRARPVSGGTSLVIVKSDLIRRHMDEIGLNLSGSYNGGKQRHYANAGAIEAGANAGNSINLGRPFGANSKVGAIE